MIVRFMLDGMVRVGSYSKENGIISRGEVLRLDEVFLLPPLPADEDRLRRPKLRKACSGAEDAHFRGAHSLLKPPSAILDPDGHIIYPPSSSQVDYEGELAVVIGKRCKNIQAEEAEKYILGYTRLQ